MSGIGQKHSPLLSCRSRTKCRQHPADYGRQVGSTTGLHFGSGSPPSVAMLEKLPVATSSSSVANAYNSLFFTVDLLFVGFAPCYSAVVRRLSNGFRSLVGIPEIGTKMTLLSASEDLRYRTLDALRGPLERLAYLASLRDESGQYSHWGLARTFSEPAARSAIAEVHSQVWIEVLRTPIPELVRSMVGMEPTVRAEVLQQLGNYRDKILPADLGGGGVRHFNSILVALSCLSKAAGATPQAA